RGPAPRSAPRTSCRRTRTSASPREFRRRGGCFAEVPCLVPGGDLAAAQDARDRPVLGDLERAREGGGARDLDRPLEGRGRPDVGKRDLAGEQKTRRKAVARQDERVATLGQRELAAVETADRLRRLEPEAGLGLPQCLPGDPQRGRDGARRTPR